MEGLGDIIKAEIARVENRRKKKLFVEALIKLLEIYECDEVEITCPAVLINSSIGLGYWCKVCSDFMGVKNSMCPCCYYGSSEVAVKEAWIRLEEGRYL